MERLSSLAKFKRTCPFLGRTKTSTLRTLATSVSPRLPSVSRLTEKATQCPVMGPALALRSSQLAKGYASVATNADLDTLHHSQGIYPTPGQGVCPHAKAGQEAARKAEELAKMVSHKSKLTSSSTKALFDYETFYDAELDKKHKDKSYRYFNNINRLAAKFPVAHTSNHAEQVDVWCSNDYLGMSKNPLVLDTMQCVHAQSSAAAC